MPTKFEQWMRRRPMMGAILGLSAACLAAAPSLAAASTALGVYFPGPAQFTVAKALGVRTLRVHVQTTGATAASTLARAKEAQAAGYRLVISYFNSCNGAPCPITDDAAYKAQFGAAIAALRPAVAVIENEENDPAQAYSVAQYERQLTDAIAVGHAAGIPVTNGGLTSMGVTLAYWHHLWTSGDHAGADAFAKVAFAPGVTPAGNLAAYLPTSAKPMTPMLAPTNGAGHSLANTEALIAFYTTSGQNSVNVHLYNLPGQLVRQVVGWLHQTTGLPVICNEMGASTADPAAVTDEVQGGVAAGLTNIIWFGPDGVGSGHAIGAANPDGTLRPGGLAFAALVSSTPTAP